MSALERIRQLPLVAEPKQIDDYHDNIVLGTSDTQSPIGVGLGEQVLVLAIVLDQSIASGAIHQFAYTLQNTTGDARITLDIAHPLVVDFVRPVSSNHSSGCQPHEQVPLRGRVEDAGVENDNR